MRGISWFRRRKHKPTDKPFTLTHELRSCNKVQFFGSQPQEYRSGWQWLCSCGLHNANPVLWASTEEEAVKEWKAHKALYAPKGGVPE